jgi:Na+/melibiose symporter-like transporter
MLASAPYFATYILDDPGMTTVLFGCLVAPAILVMPVWAWLARRVGKRAGFMLSAVLFGVASLSLLAGRSVPPFAVYCMVATCGVGYAGMQLFPLSMLPDTIDLDEVQSGAKRAGVFTGLWTAGETGAFAVGFSLLPAALIVLSLPLIRAYRLEAGDLAAARAAKDRTKSGSGDQT